MFKKILVPLDGSRPAEQALGVAGAVARAVAAELLLLRSVQPVYAPLPVTVGLPHEFEWPRSPSAGAERL